MKQFTHTPVAHYQQTERTSRVELIPALTLMLFLRRRIGRRLLRFQWLMPAAAVAYIAGLVPKWNPGGDPSLQIFGIGIAVLTVLHRLAPVVAQWRGRKAWHSYSRGLSWLSFLPLPAGFIHMILDPALCALLGWYLAGGRSPFLGYWLYISAFLLFGIELRDSRHEFQRRWDIRDGEIEGRVQSAAIMSRPGSAADAGSAGPVVVTRPPAKKWWRWSWRRR